MRRKSFPGHTRTQVIHVVMTKSVVGEPSTFISSYHHTPFSLNSRGPGTWGNPFSTQVSVCFFTNLKFSSLVFSHLTCRWTLSVLFLSWELPVKRKCSAYFKSEIVKRFFKRINLCEKITSWLPTSVALCRLPYSMEVNRCNKRCRLQSRFGHQYFDSRNISWNTINGGGKENSLYLPVDGDLSKSSENFKYNI